MNNLEISYSIKYYQFLTFHMSMVMTFPKIKIDLNIVKVGYCFQNTGRWKIASRGQIGSLVFAHV